jgi:hypothetical protein
MRDGKRATSNDSIRAHVGEKVSSPRYSAVLIGVQNTDRESTPAHYLLNRRVARTVLRLKAGVARKHLPMEDANDANYSALRFAIKDYVLVLLKALKSWTNEVAGSSNTRVLG